MSGTRKLDLLGVHIDNLTAAEAQQRALAMLQADRFHHLVTPGPEFIMEAQANPKFRRILERADLALPDGIGLRVGAWLTGQRFSGRVTGVDFTHDLIRLAAQYQHSVFLFGGRAGVADRAARRLLRLYPTLNIVGVESGWRGSWTRVPDRQVLQHIHRLRPHILLVALGAPKQELWIDAHRPALHHVRIAMGVGRTFDYLAGDIKRPPAQVRQLGLEWLYTYLFARQFHQPQFRRQRVRRATWDFVRAVWHHHYGRKT